MRKREEVIRRALERELGDAEDNLYRAKMAARSSDPAQLWGQSGQTLNEIIDGYQKRVNEVTEAMR